MMLRPPTAHQRDTPDTPIPGGAQCPDQKSMGEDMFVGWGGLARLGGGGREGGSSTVGCQGLCVQVLNSLNCSGQEDTGGSVGERGGGGEGNV